MPSLLYLCLFFNKIRDKGRTDSAWKREGKEERIGEGGREKK
jgi:hypothetical protein